MKGSKYQKSQRHSAGIRLAISDRAFFISAKINAFMYLFIYSLYLIYLLYISYDGFEGSGHAIAFYVLCSTASPTADECPQHKASSECPEEATSLSIAGGAVAKAADFKTVADESACLYE